MNVFTLPYLLTDSYLLRKWDNILISFVNACLILPSTWARKLSSGPLCASINRNNKLRTQVSLRVRVHRPRYRAAGKNELLIITHVVWLARDLEQHVELDRQELVPPLNRTRAKLIVTTPHPLATFPGCGGRSSLPPVGRGVHSDAGRRRVPQWPAHLLLADR